MEVVEVIESVLSDAIAYGFDPFDEEQRRELSEKILEELRKKFHIVPYAGQTSFE